MQVRWLCSRHFVLSDRSFPKTTEATGLLLFVVVEDQYIGNLLKLKQPLDIEKFLNVLKVEEVTSQVLLQHLWILHRKLTQIEIYFRYLKKNYTI